MTDIVVKRIADVAPYSGPAALAGIQFRPVGRALGVSAWGMNVIELEAGATTYPEHDHAQDGQEEVYAVLRGGGTLQAGDERIALSAGVMVRVGPGQRRKLVAGPEGLAVLAMGATPGKAYERHD